MRGRRERRLAPAVVAASGLVFALVLPGAGGADPSQKADALVQRQAALGEGAHAALLSLYALDSRLAQTRRQLASIRSGLAAARAEEARLSQEAAIAHRAWSRSIKALGAQLRTMYEGGEPNALGIVIGASSIDDALTRIDDLERSARVNRDTVAQARAAEGSLARLRRALTAREAELGQLEAQVEQTAAALEGTRVQRLSYLASLRRQRSLNAKEIDRLRTRAKQITERSQVIAAQQAAAPVSTPLPSATPGDTLTVTATGYSLVGHTATGMPVGWGVVAVDPSLIPLGTRLTIPGYGEGVAADTGGAVQGAMIDLWFPTQLQALAWGRRTVTVTLH